MLTHQSPAIASRYSVPSASTTVEPRPSTITRGSASSCRWATTGCSTLSRSCRTTAARPSTWAGEWLTGSLMSSSPGLDFGLDYTLDGVPTDLAVASAPVAGNRRAPRGLLVLDQEVRAPVLGPARLAALLAERALFAVADDRNPIGLDAERGQIAHRGLRAPLTQRQVVFGRPALVAMTFDQEQAPGVGLEPRRVGIEDLGVGRADVILVEIEVDVAESRVLHELARRHAGRRHAGGAGPGAEGGAAGASVAHRRLRGRGLGLARGGRARGGARRGSGGRHRRGLFRASGRDQDQERGWNHQHASHELPSLARPRGVTLLLALAQRLLQASATVALALQLVLGLLELGLQRLDLVAQLVLDRP